MDSFPLSIQTAYQDLLEAHEMCAVADIGGAPFLKDVRGKGHYWYAQQRIGNRVVDRYLGPNTPELRQRIEAAKDQRESQKTLEKRCSALVGQLRAAGLPALDRETGKVLNAMARVGTFRLGGTLVGTHAFRLYSAELGVRMDNTLAATEDVDIAAFEGLKLVIDDKVDPSLAATFKDLKFSRAPGLDEKHRSTRWLMQGGGAMVDFLVPKMREESSVFMLEPLGVHAQALPFLNLLIADPIPAVGLYRHGVLVRIPRPERYAIHKLIVAQRRAGSTQAKARKDLAQAEWLIAVLVQDRPRAVEDAFETAMASGREWRDAIRRSFKRRPAMAELIQSVT